MSNLNSWYHSEQSAKKWGGTAEDYIEIHEFIDSSKRIIGDVRHRSMYHHTEGVWLCQRIFGRTVTVGGPPMSGVLYIPDELDLPVQTEEEKQAATDEFVVRLTEAMSRPLLEVDRNIPEIRRGSQPPVYHPREVPVRLIAELHIMQDLGWIPSPKDWIDGMELKKWHGGATKEEKKFSEVFGPKRNVPDDHINMDGYEPSSSKPTGFVSHPPTEAYYDRPAQPAPQFSCPNCGKQFFNQTVMKLHATQQCVDREGRNPE